MIISALFICHTVHLYIEKDGSQAVCCALEEAPCAAIADFMLDGIITRARKQSKFELLVAC